MAFSNRAKLSDTPIEMGIGKFYSKDSYNESEIYYCEQSLLKNKTFQIINIDCDRVILYNEELNITYWHFINFIKDWFEIIPINHQKIWNQICLK